MRAIELNGTILASVHNIAIPIKCYDNVIDVNINNLSSARSCLSLLRSLKQLINFKGLKNNIKFVVSSKHILIRICGNLVTKFL